MIYQLDGETLAYMTGFPPPVKPRWPITPSLLGNNTGLDFSNKDRWGATEWRTYAMWLETDGRKRIERLEIELRAANARLSRRTMPRTTKRGSLLSGYKGAPKGRPTGSKSKLTSFVQHYARRALEMKTCKMTDVAALNAVLDEEGRARDMRPFVRSILNAMSKLKKSSLNR